MRQFGSDKPDLRLPGLTDVRPAFTDEALATLQIDPGAAGGRVAHSQGGRAEPQGARRQSSALRQEEGREVHRRLQAAGEELSRCRRPRFASSPAPPKATSSSSSPAILRTTSRPATPSSRAGCREREINVYVGGRQLPHRAGQEVCRPSRRVSALPKRWSADADPQSGQVVDGSAAFHPIWIVDFPMFEYDLASGKVGAGASSVHRAVRSRHGEPRQRSGQRARRLLRPGDERPRTRFRLHPYSSQRCAAADIRVAGNLGRGGQEALRVLPRCAGIRHAAAWRHRAGTRPYRDAAGRARPACAR